MYPRTSKNKVQFEELFFSYHKKVYAYAYKKTNSTYIAEETVQRVFIKLWDNLEHKEVLVDINAQVFCITRTVLLDIIKQENRRRHNLQEYSITDSYPSPTEIFSAKELKHQLDQHIEAMEHFHYNKDAGMFVCPAGHLAIKKARGGKKNGVTNQVDSYFFDVEKCKVCPLSEGCYKEGARTKSYSISIKSDLHKDQMAFQESDYYRRKSKERYKIEAKNSELKNVHGYGRADSYGIENMEMQVQWPSSL